VKRAGVIARAIAPAIVPVIARELGLQIWAWNLLYLSTAHILQFLLAIFVSLLSPKIHLP
jgi:hypothetical protein